MLARLDSEAAFAYMESADVPIVAIDTYFSERGTCLQAISDAMTMQPKKVFY